MVELQVTFRELKKKNWLRHLLATNFQQNALTISTPQSHRQDYWSWKHSCIFGCKVSSYFNYWSLNNTLSCQYISWNETSLTYRHQPLATDSDILAIHTKPHWHKRSHKFQNLKFPNDKLSSCWMIWQQTCWLSQKTALKNKFPH